MADGGTPVSRVETLTVLFTDLVGSTELRQQLGEEAADLLRYAHDALVTSAIASAGGTVVKSTGDGVMATFAGAADAVSAAVGVQQAIHQHNRGAEQARLAVRIGISAGDVTIEADGDCFGLPVVEAQRLEGAAAADQILCSSLVRALARGRGAHQFNSIGELPLKGLAEPVLVDEVLWEPLTPSTTETSRSRPPLLNTGSAFAFAGRDREFAALVDAWKSSRDGDGQLVLVSGEPGIGKTRLVAEFAAAALDDGGLVLAGRSDEDMTTPYGPIIDALTWWADGATKPLDLGDWPADVVRLAPELARAAAVEPPAGDADAALVTRALRSWLEHTTTDTPTLVVLDDLHWADAATLLVVRSLFDRAPVPQLLVVGTYRDTDLDRRHPLAATLADLRRHEHVTRLGIGGLDEEGVLEFISAAAGYDLDAAGRALAAGVYAETSGNPFFVGEILRHLAETGAIVQRDGTWTTDLAPGDFGIPEGIREVVGRRLSRLGDDTERVLSTAAIVGLEFDMRVVAGALGLDVDDAIDTLEHAGRAALVDEVTAERWRFAHAIVRETLLDELSSSRRVRQHRKVAAAIEANRAPNLDAVATQIAYHWSEAAAGGVDLDRALHWGTRAGDLALEAAAVDDAIHWYEHTLGLLDPDTPMLAAECGILVKLARAQALVGGKDYQTAMLKAAALAQQLGDHEQLTAALVISPHAGFSQNAEQASPLVIEALERAVAVVGTDEPSRRAQLLAALALELQFMGEGIRRAELCAEAFELATASADINAKFAALVAVFFSYPYRLFDRDMAVDYDATWRALLPALMQSGDDYQVAISLNCLWFFGISLRNRDVIAEVEAISRETVERRPTLFMRRTWLARAVLGATIRGDLEAASEQLAELETINPDLGGSQVLQFTLALEGGYAAAAIPVVEQAVAQQPQRWFVEAILLTAIIEAGDTDRANTMVDRYMDAGLEALPDDTLYYVTIGMIVGAGIALRRVDRATDLARWLNALADDVTVMSGPMYLGSVHRYRGGVAHLSGDDDVAVEHFRTAIEFESRLGAVPMLAAARLEWADMLLDRGDLDGAAELAEQALSDIGELPLVRQRRRAELVLARTRTRG
jgi:class 3 adenylate cyclase/tetratricopeptide (TPR) repeat protein